MQQMALKPWILSLGILFFTVLLYAPSFSNPLVFDDMTKIQWNPDLREAHPSITIFISPYAAQESAFRNDPSRPLTYVFYWLCWQIGGGASWPFHMLNALMHGLCAILVLFFANRMGRNFSAESSQTVGWIAALIFVTTPLLADSVVYAFALSDLLAAFFVMAALLTSGVWWGIGFYALALLCKQSAIVYPALLVLNQYVVGGKARALHHWKDYVPALLLSAVYLLVRGIYLKGFGDLEAHGDVFAAGPYALAQGLMILKYLAMTFVPIGLTIDHFLLPEMLPLTLQLGAWLLVASVTAWAVLSGPAASPRLRALAWGWLFFLLSLLPTSSVLPTVDLFVERRAYLPAVGLVVALGLCLGPLLEGQAERRNLIRILRAAFAILLLTNSGLVLARGRVFSSAEFIWSEALQAQPRSPRARLNLATAHLAHGRYQEARELLESLLAEQTQNAVVYSKLGFIFAQADYVLRDDATAWKYYQKSLELDPNDIVAVLNAGALQLKLGQFAQAEALLTHATELSPRMAYAHFALGETLLLAGNNSAAAAQLRQALELDSSLTMAREYLKRIETHSSP